ncbi:unnamed protein product, partial [Musa hybrid cultivar]
LVTAREAIVWHPLPRSGDGNALRTTIPTSSSLLRDCCHHLRKDKGIESLNVACAEALGRRSRQCSGGAAHHHSGAAGEHHPSSDRSPPGRKLESRGHRWSR